jgi:hypothetical protein
VQVGKGRWGTTEKLPLIEPLRRRSATLNLSAGTTLIGKRSEFHSIPEVSKSLEEAVLLPFLGARVEVVGT